MLGDPWQRGNEAADKSGTPVVFGAQLTASGQRDSICVFCAGTVHSHVVGVDTSSGSHPAFYCRVLIYRATAGAFRQMS